MFRGWQNGRWLNRKFDAEELPDSPRETDGNIRPRVMTRITVIGFLWSI